MVHLIGSEQPGVGTVKHTLFAGYKMDVDGQSHSELTSSQYVMLPELFTEQAALSFSLELHIFCCRQQLCVLDMHALLEI